MNCSSCGNALPAPSFKFCPFCGAAVAPAARATPVDAKAGRPASEATPAAKATAAAPSPEKAAPSAAAPAKAPVGAPPSAATTSQPTGAKRPSPPSAVGDTTPDGPAISPTRAGVSSEAPTQFEMPAVKDTMAQPMVFADSPDVSGLGAMKSARPAPTREAPQAAPAEKPRIKRKTGDGERPTEINLPAITDAELVRSPRAPEPRAPKAPAAPAAAPARKFSETAWFMAAVDPEQLTGGEGAAGSLEDAAVMTDRYTRGEPIPDEVRKNFTLADDTPRPRRRR